MAAFLTFEDSLQQAAGSFNSIPCQHITTLFLDAGNTLMSVDFEWMSRELHKMGFTCGSRILERAESAARPAISSQLENREQTQGADGRASYFEKILEALPDRPASDPDRLKLIAAELVTVLFPEGNSIHLWSRVLPGVRQALNRFLELGINLHVISNSDGTVEQSLVLQDLRSYFELVIDSHVVGYVKPDPEIFLLGLKQAGAKPEEAAYVGDIFSIDVVGAQAAGMHAVLLDPHSDWTHVDCDRAPDLSALSQRFTDGSS